MKNKMVKLIRRTVSSVVAAAMIVTGCLVIPVSADAAEDERYVTEIDEVRYVEYREYDNENCPPLGIEPGKPGGAPAYSGADDNYGYLFGGWFMKRGTVYYPIQTTEDIQAGDVICAKYVPANVLSVKCQNFADTTATTDKTSIRILSSVDSLNYKHIGFDLYRISTYDDGTYKVVTIGTDGMKYTRWTYNYFHVYSTKSNTSPSVYEPSDVFGPAAKYFTGWQIDNLANANYSKIIGIRPYWVTLDGTKVYGLSRYAHVEDGYEKYINVPVNVHSGIDVAAGMLNVSYDTSKYTLKNTECGRLFEEMTSIDDDGTIKCVGNVSSVVNKSSDNIYINLRFKPKDGVVDDGINTFDFDVVSESFANVDENLYSSTDYNVWKVQAGIITK